MNALVAAKVLIISFSSRMSPCHKTPVLVSQAVLIPARHHTTQAIEHFPSAHMYDLIWITSAVSMRVRHMTQHNPKLPSWKG